MTSKEIAEREGLVLHAVSPRLTELKLAGLVRGTGVRREGAEVIEAVRTSTSAVCA